MIEHVLFFVAGFLTATLMALAFLPALWNRAMRLSRRQLSQIVPLSMEEIAAERDQIRAAFAVDLRRLEQKLERSETLRAEALVDLGRAQTQLVRIRAEAETARKEGTALQEALALKILELYAVEAETGANAVALYDVTMLAERRRWEVLDAEGRLRSLDITLNEDRATIAALETRIVGLEARVAGLKARSAAAERQCQALTEAAREARAAETAACDEADFPALRLAISKIAEDILAQKGNAAADAG